jgi:TonB family protein
MWAAGLILGNVATETNPAPAVPSESIVLEARRGTHQIPVTLHYLAVRELRELASRPDAQIYGLLCGSWNGDGIVLERVTAARFDRDAVGVFRLQPGGWTALTVADRKKLNAIGLTRGVVLVMRPLAQRPWSATLFTVEPDIAGGEAPLAEFPWDEYVLRNGWLVDLAPPDPELERQSKPGRSRYLMNGAALVLSAAAGAAAAYQWLPARNQLAVEAPADPSPASGGKSAAEPAHVLGLDTASPVPLPPPAAPATTPKLLPRRVSFSKDAPPTGARRPAAIAPTPDRNGAIPIRRATPQLTSDVIREMRAARDKILVSVLISIDASGKVKDARVLASSGEPASGGPFIRQASLAAARQWRFRPAKAKGEAVPSEMTVLFTF